MKLCCCRLRHTYNYYYHEYWCDHSRIIRGSSVSAMLVGKTAWTWLLQFISNQLWRVCSRMQGAKTGLGRCHVSVISLVKSRSLSGINALFEGQRAAGPRLYLYVAPGVMNWGLYMQRSDLSSKLVAKTGSFQNPSDCAWVDQNPFIWAYQFKSRAVLLNAALWANWPLGSGTKEAYSLNQKHPYPDTSNR